MADLFAAAFANDVKAVRLALDQGADPNLPSPLAGTIPLQLACEGNALEVIAVLLAAGADPNKRFSWVSRVSGRRFDDHFPLLYAQSRDAVDALVRAGAKVDAVDGNGRTALEHAIQTANSEVFTALLQHNALRESMPPQEASRLIRLIEDRRAEIVEIAGPTPNDAAHTLLACLTAMDDAMRARIEAPSNRAESAEPE